MMFPRLAAPLAALALCAAAADAGVLGTTTGDAGFYQPPVPISAFARPASWFDPSRLQISTEVSMGSSFAGSGMDALQVTRLSYQFAAPLAMRVSVGNAFGPGAAAGRGSSLFLEGLDLSYRPSSYLQIQLHYVDVRSPLQLSRYGYGPSSSFWR
jgi:hypothetical protein